jgi:hypothetical protein
MLMMDDNKIVEDELLLHDSDFPNNYVNMAHTDDYRIKSEFINKELIFHRKMHHNRILLRISWQIDNDKYLPMTFVLDTGAPMYFYLSNKAIKSLSSRILEDELQTSYVIIKCDNVTKKASIQETPLNHQPANIIGLLMLEKLGLSLLNGSFNLIMCPDYF